MKESNILQRISSFIYRLIIPEERRKKKSRELKGEMCRDAIRGGVCPNDCKSCAWYGGRDED